MCVCAGCCGSAPEERPGGPFNPAASSRPCSTDLAIVPRNDSIWLQESHANSFSSNQSFEADICSVTLSDLYAGMLHSMSRLLSARPSCVISTKTFIVQNWSSRRRHKCRSRMNRTYNRGGRHTRRSPPGTLLPCPQPVKEGGVLRDCQNVRDALSHEAGLKLEKAFFEANKPQICKLDPGWKELKKTPQKLSSLTSAGCGAVSCLDQENRLMALKWLISPVRIVSRPRVLQGEGGTRYKELENEFARLHGEYFLSPRKQPSLPLHPSSSRVRTHTAGPASPGGPQGSDTPRPRTPFGKATPKSLKEAFDNQGTRAIEAERCLAKSHSFPLLPKTNPTHGPGRPQLAADLLQGNNPGVLRKSVSLSKTVSVPAVRPLGSARGRYDEIKEKFDKLHQKYCQKSPQQTKAPLYTGASPGKASVELQNQKDFSGKINPDSGFQGPQKLSSSPQWSLKRSWGSTTVIDPHACSAVAARRRPRPLGKRRRLSDPQVGGSWADSQHPSCTPGRAIAGPGEEGGSSQPYQERKVSLPISVALSQQASCWFPKRSPTFRAFMSSAVQGKLQLRPSSEEKLFVSPTGVHLGPFPKRASLHTLAPSLSTCPFQPLHPTLRR